MQTDLIVRQIIGGQRKGPLAALLRGVLGLAQWPYQFVVDYRNRRFDRGKCEIVRCCVPVISIGNLTTGGTGKTPLVCYIAKLLRRRDLRVAIVSRGYGSVGGEDNDEAMELAHVLPDVPHVQDADRVAAATIAVEELECEVILMDDGFQHRRLHRDLDIVVIDATNPFGYGYLLPRGLLREPISSLSRADVVVLSRADMVDQAERRRIEQAVRVQATDVVWCEASHRASALLSWPTTTLSLDEIDGRAVFVVAAIGNPAAFVKTVEGCGAKVAGTLFLPDHDPYGSAAVDDLRHRVEALAMPDLAIICTHKDLVKLQTDRLAGCQVYALQVELTMTQGEPELIARVNTTQAIV